MSPCDSADDRRELARLFKSRADIEADATALGAEFGTTSSARRRSAINDDLYLLMLMGVSLDWKIEAVEARLRQAEG